jgi:hypothetical protein
MFSQIIRAPRNHPQELWQTARKLIAGAGAFVGYVEGDVVVEDHDPCWLGAFVALMEQNRRLAMLGSAIDKRDFASWERARALEPNLQEEQLAGLIKLHSPERDQEVSTDDPRGLDHPHSPPGRLLLMRSDAIARVGIGTDEPLDRKFHQAGYETGIATGVRHRHLSLLNLFDYPQYDIVNRNAFMKSMNDVSANADTTEFLTQSTKR